MELSQRRRMGEKATIITSSICTFDRFNSF